MEVSKCNVIHSQILDKSEVYDLSTLVHFFVTTKTAELVLQYEVWRQR